MSDLPTAEEVVSPSPQVVPQNREAEEAVIGSVLINPETYYDVAQFLQADDFYIHRHRWIWEAFNRLHERRAPIDLLTVSEELDQQNQLEETGGPAYLTALVNNVPTSLHAEAYGRIVEEKAIRRRMLTAANDIAKLAYNEDNGVDAVMDEAEKAVFGVSERRMTRDLQSIKQVLSEYSDRIDVLSRRGEDIMGVPTGFIDLDRLLGGMQRSDFLIIAGRPGQGKTAFMLTAAKHAAMVHKKRIAIFSLEMSNEQLIQRLISQETGIDSHRLRTGKLNDEEWPVFWHAVEVLGDTRIFLDDTPGLTPLQLRTKCRRLHLEFGLDLIILDYLQLMSGGLRIENRVQEVSYISRNMKILARELDVPVLAAAQLSRAIEQRADKEPQLSDLRESGCLTGDALVALASGELKPIASLVGEQPVVVTWNGNQMSHARASKVWLTGRQPVYYMVTETGKAIRATGNHKFRALSGWLPLEILKPGDRILLSGFNTGFSPDFYFTPTREGLRNFRTNWTLQEFFAKHPVITSEARQLVIASEAKELFLRQQSGKSLEEIPGREAPPQGMTMPLFGEPNSGLSWDTITSIEPDGEEEVYDMTVPGTHNFVANGIIVHNSLEQDADIVMFIHHPGEYEKDAARQNLAQIKLSKHRNGPTGTVDLVFRSQLAKFENAATHHVDLSKVG